MSELFNLGTVRTSDDTKATAESSRNGNSNDGFPPPYRYVTDSPELHPLPPLPRHNVRTWNNEPKKKEEEQQKEREHEEEFYSPKASPSGNKQQHSPSLSPSSSPVVAVAVAATSSRSFNVLHYDKFGSKSFTSRTASYPLSYSLSRSPSLNLSPIESVKSFPPINPVSPSFSSESCSPMPREDFGLKWDGNDDTQASKMAPPVPPPLPPRFSETPVVVSQDGNGDVSVENEENLKPKLKALHWDKVKASSDRAMVWDQLRPSSFQ